MKCPKCGGEIKFYDLKPNCKHCGVNILYYSQEHELILDAKRTELEFASARIIGAKLKNAFIDGALPIIRIITTLLCVGALVLPFADFVYKLPLFEIKFSFGGLGLYNIYNDGLLTQFKTFLDSTLFSDSAGGMIIVITLFLVAFLAVAVILVFEILSFLNNKLLSKWIANISFCTAAFCAVSFFIILAIKKTHSDLSYVVISVGIGSLITAAVLMINGIINRLIFSKDVELKVREHDFERVEILKAVKKGEIKLDDLSLPVFETQEEKEKRLKDLEEALKREEEGKE